MSPKSDLDTLRWLYGLLFGVATVGGLMSWLMTISVWLALPFFVVLVILILLGLITPITTGTPGAEK